MYLKEAVVALVVFLAIDFVWLAFVAKKLYQNQIGFLLATKPNKMAAAMFYFIYGLLLVALAIHPADGNWHKALGLGALYGFATYCTYDLTNLATIKNWPLKLTVIDIAWGTILSAVVAALTTLIV